jgi:hypothetical protein
MSDDAIGGQPPGHQQRPEHRQGEAEDYEAPRVEDIPADGPAVTAAGAGGNGGLLVQAGG